jgi:hypothetical protein
MESLFNRKRRNGKEKSFEFITDLRGKRRTSIT